MSISGSVLLKCCKVRRFFTCKSMVTIPARVRYAKKTPRTDNYTAYNTTLSTELVLTTPSNHLYLHRHLYETCMFCEIHTRLMCFWNVVTMCAAYCNQFDSGIWTPCWHLWWMILVDRKSVV